MIYLQGQSGLGEDMPPRKDIESNLKSLFAQEGGYKMDLTTMLMFVVGLIAIMYFMFFRPQKKQREEHQRRMDSLRTNDKVITIGGVHGTISRVKDTTVVLKVSDRTEMEFSKDAIRTIVDPNEAGSSGTGTKKLVQEFDDDDDDFLTDEEIAEKKRRKKLNKKGAQSNKKEETQGGKDSQEKDSQEKDSQEDNRQEDSPEENGQEENSKAKSKG